MGHIMHYDVWPSPTGRSQLHVLEFDRQRCSECYHLLWVTDIHPRSGRYSWRILKSPSSSDRMSRRASRESPDALPKVPLWGYLGICQEHVLLFGPPGRLLRLLPLCGLVLCRHSGRPTSCRNFVRFFAGFSFLPFRAGVGTLSA